MLIKKVCLIVYWSLALLYIGRWPYCILVVDLIVYWSLETRNYNPKGTSAVHHHLSPCL
jgi:hypothetical protein